MLRNMGGVLGLMAFVMGVISLLPSSTSALYQIGVGIADVTGPAAEVTFMGYAKMDQKGRGIHLRQFSRAFIIGDGKSRIVFVSIDVGMIGHGVRKEVSHTKKVVQRVTSQRSVIVYALVY
ncbi:hypothetical protein J437_LFUL012328 [Ladona fulva]|uniref:Neutral ceramidase n=1 Tax=Ladona fulva TaxID=123851 RepID=A0A8K0P6Q4_LADFU|nr:hypothetical protein J437_LFUL012328 [Ladona fulva]